MHYHDIPDLLVTSQHPSKDILGTYSSVLEGKKVALGITGSMAAYKSVDVARLLMRYGAEVYPVMSEEAEQLISPELLYRACGNPPVVKLTGAVEHVQLGGNVREKADLVLVCPATANTIAKTASGIADTPVTSLLSIALGEGIPVCMAPAAHASVYTHPIVDSNIQKLKGLGIHFVSPEISEGMAKLSDTETILWSAISLLSSDGPLAGKKVVVSAGRTVEYIDPVRVITSNGSAVMGKMGIELTKALLLAGARVHLVYGKGSAVPLAGVPAEYVDTAEEMTEEIERLLESEHTDCFIAAAAAGDWKPAETHKEELSPHSEDSISLKFLPTTRIIDRIKEKFPHTYIVAFMEDSEGRKEFENGHGGASIYGGGKTSAEDSKNLPDSRRTQANADLIALDNARGGIHVFSRQGRKYHIPFSEEFKAAERLVDIVSQLMNE